jgi:Flp pilus assembly protein CpaB
MEILSKPRKLFFFLAVVFSLAAAFAVTHTINLVAGRVPVLVAAEDVSKFSKLTGENVTVQHIPRAALLDGEYLSNPEQIKDKFAQMGLAKGTVLRPSHILVPPGGSEGLPMHLAVEFTPEHRAISLPIDMSRMAGGRIQKNDIVDIIAVVSVTHMDEEITAARTVAQGIRVLDVFAPEDAPQGKRSVILAVTLPIAEEIALLAETGSIHLALTPYGATAVTTDGITGVEYLQRHFGTIAPPVAE